METEKSTRKAATIIILIASILITGCVTLNIIKGDGNSINQSSQMEQNNDSVKLDNTIN